MWHFIVKKLYFLTDGIVSEGIQNLMLYVHPTSGEEVLACGNQPTPLLYQKAAER